jgi:hypothetical protein
MHARIDRPALAVPNALPDDVWEQAAAHYDDAEDALNADLTPGFLNAMARL